MEANNTQRNIELQNEPLLAIPKTKSTDQGINRRSVSVIEDEPDAKMKKTRFKEDNIPPLLNSASTPTQSRRPNGGSDVKLSRDRPAALLSASIISQHSVQRSTSQVSS